MIGHQADAARGFLFDPNGCTGCGACVLACTTENELPWGTSWRHVVPFNENRRPGVPSFHLSLACNHCDAAPCVEQCPAMAIQQDPATGVVLILDDRCIGCGYCSWVCPYGAPAPDPVRGVMTKCTLCRHRLVDGHGPACVESCPTDALRFGPLDGEPTLPGFPERPARPRIRFAPLRRDAAPPETSWQPTGPAPVLAPGPSDPQPISFRLELPLWLFTSGAAALVGWMLAAVGGGIAMPAEAFLLLAMATLAVSTLHLGKRSRAWRAVLNLRRSRLSREVAVYGAFLAVALIWKVLYPTSMPAGMAAVGVGMLALFAMDRVYDPVRRARGGTLHSADVVLTGPLMGAAFLHWSVGFAAVAAVKGVLFGRRALRPAVQPGLPESFIWARLGLGLVLPPVIWVLAPGPWGGVGVVLVTLAELADRGVFYEELEVITPRKEAGRRAATWKERPGRKLVAEQRPSR